MDPADLSGLLALLAEATLAASVALLLVLVVRRPLRNAFGATVAYLAWALVPAAVVAVALPAAPATVAAVPAATLANAAVAPMAAMPVAAPLDVAQWLFAAWVAGALVMALRLGWQQRAFRRGLGVLRLRADGLQQAESVAGLPAAVGLLRPAIVVPMDFDSRYSRQERELMHAHERSHIRHGDLQINALVACLRSVFWFNPLLHHAERHFRHDQELACDQRVIARHPHGRRAYGEAMVKTQLASQPLPLGCHWGYSHPLKERIAMLKQPTPTAARWIGGATVVVVLALGVGFSAWSAQPKRELAAASELPAGMLMTQMELSIDGGEPKQLQVISKPDEPFAIRTEQAGQRWEMRGTASPLGDGRIVIATSLSRDGKLVESPEIVVREGEKAMIEIGDRNIASGAFKGIALRMLVTAAANLPPPLPPAPQVPGAIAPPAPPAPSVPTAKAPPAPLAPSVPTAKAPPAPPAPPVPTAKAPPAPLAVPPLPPQPAAPESPTGSVNRMAAPAYPADALAKRLGGKVAPAMDIDAQGTPAEVGLESSGQVGVFDQAAVDAAMK